MVARLADGSMRDAQTLLDRVQTFCAGKITAAEASKALGSVDRTALLTLAQNITKRDVSSVLECVAELFSTGSDPATLLKEFTNFWREVFIAKLGGEARLKALGLGADTISDLLNLVAKLEVLDLQDLWDLAREGADRCMRSAYPRYGFEALVVRMSTRQPMHEIGELIGQLRSQPPAVGVSRPTASVSSAAPIASSKGTSVAQPVAPQFSANNQAANINAQSGAALSWSGFLSFVSERGGKILLENLKRLNADRFENGNFEASGPEFIVGSLGRDKAKLEELLSAFVVAQGLVAQGHSVTRWKINLKKGAASAEVADPLKAQASKMEEIESHPALQSLQKIFPGSKVEQVKVKSE
jgi:DNA polymerase III gamma/tau subunit